MPEHQFFACFSINERFYSKRLLRGRVRDYWNRENALIVRAAKCPIVFVFNSPGDSYRQPGLSTPGLRQSLHSELTQSDGKQGLFFPGAGGGPSLLLVISVNLEGSQPQAGAWKPCWGAVGVGGGVGGGSGHNVGLLCQLASGLWIMWRRMFPYSLSHFVLGLLLLAPLVFSLKKQYILTWSIISPFHLLREKWQIPLTNDVIILYMC